MLICLDTVLMSFLKSLGVGMHMVFICRKIDRQLQSIPSYMRPFSYVELLVLEGMGYFCLPSPDKIGLSDRRGHYQGATLVCSIS